MYTARTNIHCSKIPEFKQLILHKTLLDIQFQVNYFRLVLSDFGGFVFNQADL